MGCVGEREGRGGMNGYPLPTVFVKFIPVIAMLCLLLRLLGACLSQKTRQSPRWRKSNHFHHSHPSSCRP